MYYVKLFDATAEVPASLAVTPVPLPCFYPCAPTARRRPHAGPFAPSASRLVGLTPPPASPYLKSASIRAASPVLTGALERFATIATISPLSRFSVMTVLPPTDPPVWDTMASPWSFVLDPQPRP